MLPVIAQILGGVNGDNAIHLAGKFGIDAEDTAMRVVAAHEGGVQHARQLYVIGEQRLACEQEGVFVSFDALAEIAG